MSNENIELLNSYPRESIIKLAIPIIVTLITLALYNVIDGIWVAGLGNTAISGVGLVSPLWMLISGIATGLSSGVTSSIARFRGQSDEKANNVGEQAIILFIVSSIILSVLMLIVLFPFLDIYSTSPDIYNQGVEYTIPLFVGLFTFMFSSGLAAILRAEGDTKRAMYATSFGLILNAALDPVFIYCFNMGVAGAAFSSVFTSAITSLIIFYWIFIKKDTYIKLNNSNIIKFKIDWEILKDILNTGIPASFVLFMLSLASFVFYYFINIIGGSFGVSVFSLGYRLYLLEIVPLMAICHALVAVVGNHFGHNNIKLVRKSHDYACLYCVIFGIVIAISFITFSEQLGYIFAISTNNLELVKGVSHFIDYTALCMPFLGINLPSTYLYQGLGKGLESLLCTTFTEIICTIPATYLFAFTFNYGLAGIWMGFVFGRGFASIITFIFARYTIHSLEKNACLGD